MISDSMESPLAIKYQPRLYGQAASYQKLADGRSHIQGFTSGPENGRSMGLKVKGPKTYDSQSGKLYGFENQKWIVFRTESDHENLRP